MKVALVSKRTIDNNVEFNLNQIISTIEQLKNDVDLICFGEAFLQGFNSLSWNFDTDKSIAIPNGSNIIKEIQAKVKEKSVAIAFGYLEYCQSKIYSSYILIGKSGEIVTNFRRVSKGWKEFSITDDHYKEGENFYSFDFLDKKIVIAVCGDLWEDGNIEYISQIKADLLLYPVYITYDLNDFENEIKQEYVEQLSKTGFPAAMVNSICLEDKTLGGCFFVNHNEIVSSLNMGKEGTLIIEI